MLSLRATTLAAIAFMHYHFNGKPIDELRCPLCEGQLYADQVQYHTMPREMYGRKRHTMEDAQLSYRGRCTKCGGCVEVSNALLSTLGLTGKIDPNKFKTKSVEYIVMGITAVKYGRIKSLPNYENERMEVEVELKDGQTPEAALIEAKRFVKTQLGLGPSDKDVKAARQLLIEAGELSA